MCFSFFFFFLFFAIFLWVFLDAGDLAHCTRGKIPIIQLCNKMSVLPFLFFLFFSESWPSPRRRGQTADLLSDTQTGPALNSRCSLNSEPTHRLATIPQNSQSFSFKKPAAQIRLVFPFSLFLNLPRPSSLGVESESGTRDTSGGV